MRHMHIVEYSSAIKRNDTLIRTTTWRKLENITLNERRPYSVWFYIYKMSRNGNFIGTENRSIYRWVAPPHRLIFNLTLVWHGWLASAIPMPQLCCVESGVANTLVLLWGGAYWLGGKWSVSSEDFSSVLSAASYPLQKGKQENYLIELEENHWL